MKTVPTTAAYIPFHRADITDEEIDAVVAVLRSGWLTSGPKVEEFEQAFARFIGVKHAVAVNSATAALHLALEAAGVRAGDEVIVPSMTFAACGEVVLYLGATPVLADVDPDTLTLRARDIEPLLTPKTRAVLPVHYGGHASDMDPIMELAASRDIAVIDDAAHALPAAYRGRAVGTLGHATAFSFYATKTLTTGEGGMLTTSSDAIADRARLMRLHGISRHAWNRYSAQGTWRYEILDAGFKYNLTDIAAAIGLVQLRRQHEMLERRRRIANLYDQAFAATGAIRPVGRRADVEHAWHLYAIRIDLSRLRIGRDELMASLRDRGIGASVHFIPMHLHPLYQSRFGYADTDCPNASAAFKELVSLPLFPGMSDAEVSRVIDVVSGLMTEHAR